MGASYIVINLKIVIRDGMLMFTVSDMAIQVQKLVTKHLDVYEMLCY